MEEKRKKQNHTKNTSARNMKSDIKNQIMLKVYPRYENTETHGPHILHIDKHPGNTEWAEFRFRDSKGKKIKSYDLEGGLLGLIHVLKIYDCWYFERFSTTNEIYT